MAKSGFRNSRLRWLFLSCIIILSAAAAATLVAVLLFAFDITDSGTAVIILCFAVAIAAVAAVLSMIMRRVVLAPVSRLSQASRQIAAAIESAQLMIYPQWGHGVYEEEKTFNGTVLEFLK